MGGHTAPADVFVKRFFLLLNFQRAGSNTGFMRCWVLLLHRSREGWGGGWQWRSIPASKSHCCGAQSLKFRNAKPISFFFLSRCNVLNPSRVAPQPATRGMTTNPRQKTHYGGRPGSSLASATRLRGPDPLVPFGFHRTSNKYDICAERGSG